jgi:hypothetical protein
MTTTTKVPTPQGISRLLSETPGFEKSVSSSTRIRGYRSHSWGFIVRRGDEPGQVKVHHEHGNFVATDATRREQVEMQEKYAEVIEAAGFAVQRGEGGAFGPLIVTAKETGR